MSQHMHASWDTEHISLLPQCQQDVLKMASWVIILIYGKKKLMTSGTDT